MSYSRKDIKTKVGQALKNPATLYTKDFVNYRGNVVNGERYTEIAAMELRKQGNLTLLRGIPKITREASYKTESHKELAKREKPSDSNREEEWIAIGLYGKKLDCIGKVIDFQTPLKDGSGDTAGKIDLLSYNKNENTAYILELKKPQSEETLLRCVLEAYTYWKTVDKKKLLRDFELEGVELRKAVLVFKNSVAYNDFIGDECDAVYSLMTKQLGVDLFVLNKKCDNIIEGYKHRVLKKISEE